MSFDPVPAVKPAAVVGPRLRTSYVGPDARAKSANAAPPRPPGGAARAAYALVRGFTTSTRRGKSTGSFLGTKARDGETTIRGLYASPSARLAFGACRPLGDGKRRVTRAASGDACHQRAGACDPGTSSSWKIARAEQATGVEPAEVSVAHWPVTSTRLLGGGFAGHRSCGNAVASKAGSGDPCVPPPGIEPGPPGLQPDAQTN